MWESEVGEAGEKQSLPAVKVVTLGTLAGNSPNGGGEGSALDGEDRLPACLTSGSLFFIYLYVYFFFNTGLS